MSDVAVCCEVCGGPCLYWGTVHAYRHFRCSQCRHLFVFPRPAPDVLEAFYQKGEYYGRAEEQAHRLVVEANGRGRLLEGLARRYKLDRRLLDVGCASGIFLSEAIKLGWTARGVDRSSRVGERARQQTGCRVDIGVFEEMEIPGSPFQVVTAWEVLEHAIDPRRFLAALSRHVAPGGLVAISTPMSDGVVARVLGTRYPMLTPPEHLSLFSWESLKRLAAEQRLVCVAWKSFSNLTADALSSGFARFFVGRELNDLGSGMQWVARLFGYSMAWVPLLIDAVGGGSEMEVVFRKVRE